jgi:hypothetical protein
MKHRPAPVIAIPLPHDQQKKEEPDKRQPRRFKGNKRENTVCATRNMNSAVRKSKPVSHIIMCFPESTQLSVVSRPPG